MSQNINVSAIIRSPSSTQEGFMQAKSERQTQDNSIYNQDSVA